MSESKNQVTGEKNTPLPPKLPEAGKGDFSSRVKSLFHGKFSENLQNINKPTSSVKEAEKKPTFEGEQTEKLYNIKDLTSNMTPVKIIKLVSLVLGVFMILTALYVKVFKKEPVKPQPVMVNLPTPSYSPYQKYKPSIYADDPNFKKIDEGLSVLENEVKNITLEEQSLLPPTLDFDVVFR